jgi:hypothetical protein
MRLKMKHQAAIHLTEGLGYKEDAKMLGITTHKNMRLRIRQEAAMNLTKGLAT